MSNIDLVRSVRGLRHKVGPLDEALLEEIYLFLEGLRAKAPALAGPRSGGLRKVLTLPPQVRDWYVPREMAGRPQWLVQSDAEEQQLHRHLATLHRLGIPTFLREQPQLALMRLFMSVETHVQDVFVPEEEPARTAFWAALKEGVVQFVVSAMAEAVVQLFGTKASSNLVAVLDGSGFSVADCRWKLSLRISFLEIAVSSDTARRARDLLIERLDEVWARTPLEGWAAALEAVDRTLPGAEGADAAAPRPSLWESAVDERAFQKGSQHRLVWCDTALGELMLPEQRPLEPHALLHASLQAGGMPEVRRVKAAEDLADSDWVRLGSTWTAAQAATEFYNVRPSRRRPFVATPQSRPAAAQGPAAAGAEAPADAWCEYRTPEGQLYYYRPATGETAWALPPGASLAPGPQQQQWRSYRTDEGQVYFHNAATGESSWALPEGADLVDAAYGGC
mmetsp:Transcript_97037/g.313342  ORF Transcript_97037/g.313342 Transcript_97037/m.313342 type:complete len:450 (+) Transcript_97037:60-1409(+)